MTSLVIRVFILGNCYKLLDTIGHELPNQYIAITSHSSRLRDGESWYSDVKYGTTFHRMIVKLFYLNFAVAGTLISILRIQHLLQYKGSGNAEWLIKENWKCLLMIFLMHPLCKMYPLEIYMGEMFNYIFGWDIGFLTCIWYQTINVTSAITLRRIASHSLGDVVIIFKV